MGELWEGLLVPGSVSITRNLGISKIEYSLKSNSLSLPGYSLWLGVGFFEVLLVWGLFSTALRGARRKILVLLPPQLNTGVVILVHLCMCPVLKQFAGLK